MADDASSGLGPITDVRWLRSLERRRRAQWTAVLAVFLIGSLLVASNHITGNNKANDVASSPAANRAASTAVSGADPAALTPAEQSVVAQGSAAAGKAGTAKATTPRGTVRPGADLVNAPVTGGTVPPGVTPAEISVAYYWKGDRTMTSPYLKGTGQEGNVDEGKAFLELIDYINKHPNGDATFMGFRFKLHGRKLKGTVLEAGQYPDTYAATGEKLAKEVKPFAAISSHGSLSAYICPRLARAGIANIGTYDLGGSGGNLVTRSNGYCTPAGMSWERQVAYSVGYLTGHSKTQYTRPDGLKEPRVYGVIYVEYPGLVDAAPKMIDKLKAAGINVAETATLASDLATSQQQAINVVAKMRAKGVNTLVLPDAGAPLNFTHASQTSEYHPDYFVWPCSGQDSIGMVRLYNAGQWSRASGLTCYDKQFNADLVNSNSARRTEWWKHYQEGAGTRAEPPAPTPYVYASLHQLLVGITNAGPNITVEAYRSGMLAFEPYRYDAIDGRTDDPTNMLLTLNSPDQSAISDVAKLFWSPTTVDEGSGATGSYEFPDPRRHSSPSF